MANSSRCVRESCRSKSGGEESATRTEQVSEKTLFWQRRQSRLCQEKGLIHYFKSRDHEMGEIQGGQELLGENIKTQSGSHESKECAPHFGKAGSKE